MKVRVCFTLEFDADEYREAYGIPGEPFSADEIRKELSSRASSNLAIGMSDDGVNVEVRHRK